MPLSARRALFSAHCVGALSLLAVPVAAQCFIDFEVNAETALGPARVPPTLSFVNAESVTPIVPVQAAVIPLCTSLTFYWETVGGETWMLVIYQGSEVVDGFPFRFYENLTDLSHTIPVAEALPTGQYTWYVVASTFAGYTTSGYRQFTIQPSCPADINGDGIVDPDDLTDFIGCYFNIPPCPAADFNADATTDPDDLADFIAAFFLGC